MRINRPDSCPGLSASALRQAYLFERGSGLLVAFRATRHMISSGIAALRARSPKAADARPEKRKPWRCGSGERMILPRRDRTCGDHFEAASIFRIRTDPDGQDSSGIISDHGR